MKVLIAGGGIGGLTTALCCLQRGHEVTVLEQAEALLEIGAGLQLSPNAMQVMQALGLREKLETRAFRPEAGELRMGRSGMKVFSFALADAADKRWNAPYLHIHRADLVSVLSGAIKDYPSGSIELSSKLAGYEQTDNQVTAHLEGGASVQGDVLIGADGIHSVIREHMHGPDAPRFTGNVAWRATVPVERLGEHRPPRTACAWVGRGRHAVTYLLRCGDLANFVGVVETSEPGSETWTQQGDKASAIKDFTGWHPVITTILQQSDTLYRWALYDRAPLERWTDGRVALLGDAAHPMLPFMAQGAAMAIEDAYVLAKHLEDGAAAKDDLIAYQDSRFERTRRVQAASRANSNIFHRKSALTRLATYGPMWLAGRVSPGFYSARQDWIYGHDVTSEISDVK